ncbi:hypothetical protein HSR121_0474 [Halapricum desulfuricans]|uniref:Uncharacterized protein n=1 Tax=Halapricum desulfuricans TaxID=2841257 RepID=A0A897MRR1_9EURY|nr:hypothetical protein HSR121_0474 [Halapricum desulfuricans]
MYVARVSTAFLIVGFVSEPVLKKAGLKRPRLPPVVAVKRLAALGVCLSSLQAEQAECLGVVRKPSVFVITRIGDSRTT